MPKDHVVSSAEPACQESPNIIPKLSSSSSFQVGVGDSGMWPRGTLSTMPNSAERQILRVFLHRFPGLTLIPGPLLHVSVCMAEYARLPKCEPNREAKPPVIHTHTHQPTDTRVNTHKHRPSPITKVNTHYEEKS